MKIYKDIPGFSMYSINEDGKCIRKEYTYLNNGTECIKPAKECVATANSAGYYQFNMKDDSGKWRRKYVHVLVAEAFVPKPNIKEKVEVNHIDGDKSHNYKNNLEWVTHSNNLKHAINNGLFKPYELNPAPKFEIPPKEQLNDMLSYFNCYNDLAMYYNVSDETIRRWCNSYNISISKRCIYNPSKQELYDMMKYFKSFIVVAKYYNVNESSVRKWCRKYDMPDTVDKWKL